MWRALFERVNPTPLQKVMVAVNRGTSAASDKKQLSKKELVLSLDDSITRIENERQRIERFKEKCSDMMADARQSNKMKGGGPWKNYTAAGNDGQGINIHRSLPVAEVELTPGCGIQFRP
jgi:hypothetical protein